MPSVPPDYAFQPHERPLMPGSPATPDHPGGRRIAYALIGVLISLTGGLLNALLSVNLAQIQGDLALTSVEGGWLIAAYSMTNVWASFLLIKFRQQFGLQRVTRVVLLAFVAINAAQLFVHGFATEVAVRAVAGVIAAGFTPLGFFYIMQAMPAKARLAGMIAGVGLGQAALPLARVISPALLGGGDIANLFILEFGLSLLCLGCVALLRLPPSERLEVFEPLDGLTMALFAPGIALICVVLAQGRIVWWTTPWLGYALAGGFLLTGAAMLVEHHRANPMLNTRWLAGRDMIRFVAVAATMRVLLSEQAFGSTGLLTAVGMGPDQMVTLYVIITLATLAGLMAGIATLNPLDLIKPLLISIALVIVGAFMDASASNLTRPANFYISQSLIAFAAIYFIGPTMMTGVIRALARGRSHMISFSAAFGISQQLGGLGGSALLGSVQVMREKFHSHELTQSLTLADPQVAQRIQQLGGAFTRTQGDVALRQGEGAMLLAQQVSREANILAFNDVFLLIGVLACIAFVYMGTRWLFFRARGVNPLAEELAALQRLLASR